MITIEQLVKIMPFAKKRAPLFIDAINHAMDEFEINTNARAASFLSQVGHESGQLLYVLELASGDAYEGRRDLGNTWPGDGRRYKGRGLIQITGRSNYLNCGDALNLDLINRPELLEDPSNAAMSAGWWWKNHGCNELADTGDQEKVTRRVNGGVNGLADRLALFAVAVEVLK